MKSGPNSASFLLSALAVLSVSCTIGDARGERGSDIGGADVTSNIAQTAPDADMSSRVPDTDRASEAACEALAAFDCPGCSPRVLWRGDASRLTDLLNTHSGSLFALLDGNDVHQASPTADSLAPLFSLTAEERSIPAFTMMAGGAAYVRFAQSGAGELIFLPVLFGDSDAQPTLGQPITVFDEIGEGTVLLSGSSGVIAAAFDREFENSDGPVVTLLDRVTSELVSHRATDSVRAVYARPEKAYWLVGTQFTQLYGAGADEPVAAVVAKHPGESRTSAFADRAVFSVAGEDLWRAELDQNEGTFELVLEEIGATDQMAASGEVVVWSDAHGALHGWAAPCSRPQLLVDAPQTVRALTMTDQAIFWRTEDTVARFP